MGYRTVVMLNNDFCTEWKKDPELGKKISEAMNYIHPNHPRYHLNPLGQYGRVVECVHADTQSLVRLSDYENFEELSNKYRTFNYKPYHEQHESDMLDLLKEAADKLGYRLVKKSAKKA